MNIFIIFFHYCYVFGKFLAAIILCVRQKERERKRPQEDRAAGEKGNTGSAESNQEKSGSSGGWEEPGIDATVAHRAVYSAS